MASQSAAANSLHRLFRVWLDVERDELAGLLLSFASAFTMFTAYAMLRPVRDAMGVTSGVRSLPLLFWATFVVTLLIQPLYGWVLTRWSRAVALPACYVLIATTLVAFNVWFYVQSDHTWIARAYFVWVSVFNLFVIAMLWSVMADVFTRAQAGRLFGFIAGGLSLGGLAGPALAATLAKPLGTVNLLLVAAALLLLSAYFVRRTIRWHVAQPLRSKEPAGERPLEAGVWDAFKQVTRSPFLLLICMFVLLLTFVSTILYVEQQRLVGEAIKGRDAQTTFFATLDFWVQAGSLLLQFFLFPRLLKWLGFTRMLVLVPLLMMLAFAATALAPVLTVVAAAMVMRRIGEYGITRPCRDMLFTVVSPGEKYMAKSLIDTFVYRGGDAISASIHAGVVGLAASTAFAAATPGALGVAIAGAWVFVALVLARRFNAHREEHQSTRNP